MHSASRAFVIAGLFAAIGVSAPAQAQVYFMAAAPANDDHCFLRGPSATPVYMPQQFPWIDLLSLVGGIAVRLDDSGRGGGGGEVDNAALDRANKTLDSCDQKLDKIADLLETRLKKHDTEIAELARKQEETTQALDKRITETTELVKKNSEQIKDVTGLIAGNTQLIDELQVEVKVLQPINAKHTVETQNAAVPRFKKSDGSEPDGQFPMGPAVDVEVVKAFGDYRLVKFKDASQPQNQVTYVKASALKAK